MQKNTRSLSLPKKFIIIMLIITLTISNFLIVGENLVTYAADAILDNQTQSTINKNVKFDTYFKKDNGNTHYLVCDVNSEDANMTLDLSVESGFLKDAKIELKDVNYDINNIVDPSEKVQEASMEQISLRQINAGERVELGFIIGTKLADTMKLADVSKDSKVVLKAIYVDENGKEIEIEKEVTINISWTGTFENEVSLELEKYTNFIQDGEEKVLVQVSAKTGLKETTNKLPIKETNIQVTAPNLAGAKPEQVVVLPRSTMNTNGAEEGMATIPDENITKDLENGLVKIKIENNKAEGNVWTGKGNDEILLTFIYNKKDMTEEITTIATKVTSEITMYNGNNANNETTAEFDLASLKGSIVSLDLSTKLTEINKGKMYANSVVAEKQYETIIDTKAIVEISYKDIVSEIKLDEGDTYFTDAKGNKYLLGENIYYKSTTISKENFEKILGQEGKITVLDENGNTVTTIENVLEVDDSGNYVIEYANQYAKLSFITTKPIQEGELCIVNQRAVSPQLSSSKAQITKFNNLLTKMKV